MGEVETENITLEERIDALVKRVDMLTAEVLGFKELQGRTFSRFDDMIDRGLALFNKIQNEGLAALLRDLMSSRRRRKKVEDAAPGS
jgi:hypothetical protein